jgi:hypothetical protein
MIPRLHPRGTSFKGASTYLLHDKQQGEILGKEEGRTRGASFKGAADYLLHDKHASTSERVAWTHMVNLFSRTTGDAWFEMMDTWRDRNALKKAAGFKASGRDNKAPVLHMSLSWHPDETPSADHMRETALSALKALGVQQHQALIVAHNDEPHPHVHLLINTVNPVTGKTANLKHSKETLSRWAEAYERAHGQIRCEERVRNNARRAGLRQERQAEREASKAFAKAVWQGQKPEKAPAPSKPYEPVKDRSPSRRRWIETQLVIAHMRGLRSQQYAGQKLERDSLWVQQQAKLNVMYEEARAKLGHIRQNIREHYRPEWTRLYRNQQAERRHLTKAATHPFERACYVFANRQRLAGPAKPLSLRQIAALVVSPKRLMQTVDRMHERQRQRLAQVEKTHHETLTEKAWAAYRAQATIAKGHFKTEREYFKASQKTQAYQITWADARASLKADQSAAREQTQAAAPSPLPGRENRAPPEAEWPVRDQARPAAPFPPTVPQPAHPANEMNEWLQEIRQMRRRGRGRDFGREMD